MQTDDTLISTIDWDKQADLVPAVVQDHLSGQVLMLGYMNRKALEKTLVSGIVTFYSRSKGRLWTKGETSGHYLRLIAIAKDCDDDSLLLQVIPEGPTCHKGTQSCWNGQGCHPFLNNLAALIASRKEQAANGSYTWSLFAAGTKRIAQKVGEEGLETALAAATHDREELVDEAADLLFHLLVLLEDQDLSLADISLKLLQRHQRARK